MNVASERRIHVLVVARYVLPWPYDRHELDYAMFMKWCERVRVSLIVQSKDGKTRKWQNGALTVHYVAGTSVPVVRVLKFVANALRTTAAIHRESPVDILSASDLSGGLVGILARMRLKIKLLQQVQGAFLEGPGLGPRWAAWLSRPALRALVVYLCGRADMVRCLYSAAAKLLLARGIPRRKIAVIPSRCDVGLFSRANGSDSQIAPTILFVGTLLRAKGVRTLVESTHQLLRNGIDCRLWIAGDGPDREYLEARTQKLGLNEHVKFWGRVPHPQLPAIMQQSYLLALPSHSEATPRVIMEAMAMELPVVAAGVGGIPEMISHGETGLLVKPNDPAELCQAIGTLLSDPARARAMGRRGRKRAVERYDLDRYVSRMVALHEEAVNA